MIFRGKILFIFGSIPYVKIYLPVLVFYHEIWKDLLGVRKLLTMKYMESQTGNQIFHYFQMDIEYAYVLVVMIFIYI